MRLGYQPLAPLAVPVEFLLELLPDSELVWSRDGLSARLVWGDSSLPVVDVRGWEGQWPTITREV